MKRDRKSEKIIAGIGFSFNAYANEDENKQVVLEKQQTDIVQNHVEQKKQINENEIIEQPEQEKAINTDGETDTTKDDPFIEAKMITNKIELEDFSYNVAENNLYKRIMLIKDHNRQKQYKKIYVKKKIY